MLQDSIQLVTGVKEAMKDNKDQFLVAKLFKPKSVKKRVEVQTPLLSIFLADAKSNTHTY